MPRGSCILARVGQGLSTPQSELASLDLNNHRGWFCEQGHRGFKGEKGEPGLPGLDGLDAPCPLVWHHPPFPAWPVWASPRVRLVPVRLSRCASPAALHTPACHSSLSRHQGSPCLSWSSGGSRHVPLLHAQSARMLSWLPPAAASKAHHLNVSGPPHPMPTLAASDPPFRTASRQTCHQKESQGSGFSGQVTRIVTSLPSHTAVSWKSVGKTFQ